MLEWADYESAFNWCVTCFDNVLSANDQIEWYYDQAQDALDINDVKAAVQALVSSRNYFLSAHRNAFAYRYFYNPESGVLALCNFLAASGNGYELTMQKIIDTMWKSNPLETFFFVNYIDGMRASIWNLEIGETHLRDIYTHFLSWE